MQTTHMSEMKLVWRVIQVGMNFERRNTFGESRLFVVDIQYLTICNNGRKWRKMLESGEKC